MTAFQNRVDEWNKQDRQWRRVDRLAHAEYQYTHAASPQDHKFWRAVIKANTLPSSVVGKAS